MEKVTKTTLCHHFPVVLPSGPCSPSGPPFTSSSFIFSHGIVSQWYKMPRSTRPRARTSKGPKGRGSQWSISPVNLWRGTKGTEFLGVSTLTQIGWSFVVLRLFFVHEVMSNLQDWLLNCYIVCELSARHETSGAQPKTHSLKFLKGKPSKHQQAISSRFPRSQKKCLCPS